MFSHVTIGSNDLERASRFYDAVLGPIGLVQRPIVPDGGPPSRAWIKPGQRLPHLSVFIPFDGRPASAGNGTMLAFLAPSPAAVDAAWEAGMDLGGTDEGRPGERPHYGSGYYGAYLRDPDGNKIHIVFRGDLDTTQ